jgi:hypothetical protein
MHAFSHIFISVAVAIANVQLLFQITVLWVCAAFSGVVQREG